MKIENIIFCLSAFATTLSCTPSPRPEKIEKTASEAKIQSVDQPIKQDCFDAKMEKWYIAFNSYQAQGYDMAEADKKAVEDSKHEFYACKENKQKHLAGNLSEEESEE